VLNPQELSLEPHQTGTVNYDIIIPEDAKGEYIAIVFFSSVPEPSGAAVSVVSRIGNSLYVIIKGTEIIEGEIGDLRVRSANPLKLDVTVENSGNIHIRPQGKIVMKRQGLFLKKREKRAIEIPFNEGGFPVLPDRSHTFSIKTKENLKPGSYNLGFDLEYSDGHFLKEEWELKIDRKGGASLKKRP
jgi:methionine-rich copper-binding protein CopC